MVRQRFGWSWALAAVLLVAFGLRVLLLGWGVPLDPYTNTYHPDEPKIIQGAVDFPTDILTRQDLRYPTGYHYLIGLLTLPLRPALHRLADGDAFLTVTLLGRLCTLLLAMLTVWATYRLGWRWYDRRAGIIAAAFLAVLSEHVMNGAWATLDVPSAFLAVVALWRCDVLVQTPSRRNSAILALASGLLIGTKYPGGVVLVPAILAHVIGYRKARPAQGWWRSVVCLELPLYLALTVAVTLATTPTILLRPENLKAAVLYESQRQNLAGMDRLQFDMLFDAVGSLATALSQPVAWLFAFAALGALVRPTYREALILSFILPYTFVLGDRAANRYLIILLPAYCLLSGRLLSRLMSLRWPAARVGVGVATAALWTVALGYTFWTIQLRLQPDARTAAARYLAEQALPGSTVCLLQPGERNAQRWKEPRVSDERFQRVDCLSHPDFVLTIGGGEGRWRKALASPYLGAEYRWDSAHADWWPEEQVPAPDELRFYDDLLNGRDPAQAYRLVAEFRNEELSVAPFMVSVVRVYLRRSDGP